MDFSDPVYEKRRFIFQEISSLFPSNPWVIKAAEKMKSYSKKEYDEMLKESYMFEKFFNECLSDGIKVPSTDSEKLFEMFIKHIEWFFKVDKESYNELIELCSPSKNQFLAVNSNYASALFDILIEYRKKLNL